MSDLYQLTNLDQGQPDLQPEQDQTDYTLRGIQRRAMAGIDPSHEEMQWLAHNRAEIRQRLMTNFGEAGLAALPAAMLKPLAFAATAAPKGMSAIAEAITRPAQMRRIEELRRSRMSTPANVDVSRYRWPGSELPGKQVPPISPRSNIDPNAVAADIGKTVGDTWAQPFSLSPMPNTMPRDPRFPTLMKGGR